MVGKFGHWNPHDLRFMIEKKEMIQKDFNVDGNKKFLAMAVHL